MRLTQKPTFRTSYPCQNSSDRGSSLYKMTFELSSIFT